RRRGAAGGREPLLRAPDHLGREVERDHASALRDEPFGVAPGAAADLEDTPAAELEPGLPQQEPGLVTRAIGVVVVDLGPLIVRRRDVGRGRTEIEGHELLVVVAVPDLEAARLDRDGPKAAGLVEGARPLVEGGHVEPQELEAQPGSRPRDHLADQPTAESGPALLGAEVHAPDVSDVSLLEGRLPMAAGHTRQTLTG